MFFFVDSSEEIINDIRYGICLILISIFAFDLILIKLIKLSIFYCVIIFLKILR